YAIPSRPYFTKVLKSAVLEWGLNMTGNNNQGIAVVTDNARNMDVAGMLNLPAHKLIMDVATRWNSSLDMLERYLEQQQAIAATLLSAEVRRNAREIDTLEPADIMDAEDMHMIEQSMAQCDEDSSTIAQIKRAILKDFTDRYQGEQNKFLQESTALEPWFRSLHQLNDSHIFDRLKLKATQMQNQNPSETEGERAAVPHTAHDADKEQSPPSKKTALEDLLGESFSKEVPCAQLNAVSRRSGLSVSDPRSEQTLRTLSLTLA
ncbi:hypothetical protein KUCAC02_012211, partial [Chaenocephalus aceratus]